MGNELKRGGVERFEISGVRIRVTIVTVDGFRASAWGVNQRVEVEKGDLMFNHCSTSDPRLRRGCGGQSESENESDKKGRSVSKKKCKAAVCTASLVSVQR